MMLLAADRHAAPPRTRRRRPRRQATSPALLAKSVGDLTAAEEEEFSTPPRRRSSGSASLCHPFENIIKTRRTVREWTDQVTTMSQRGAPGPRPDFTLIKKYLTRYYGIVRVNTRDGGGTVGRARPAAEGGRRRRRIPHGATASSPTSPRLRKSMASTRRSSRNSPRRFASTDRRSTNLSHTRAGGDHTDRP